MVAAQNTIKREFQAIGSQSNYLKLALLFSKPPGTVPAFAGLNTRFFEQLLHRPLTGGEFGLSPERARLTTVLGDPRRTEDPKPSRMPVPERYHAATDPQGVTSWGKVAGTRMAARGHVLRIATNTLPPGHPFPWSQLGLPYQLPDYKQAAQPFLAQWSRPVRMLSLISNHGALDLEIPDLLLHLFPQWFQVRFLLGGDNRGKICEKTEGSAAVDALCASHRLRPAPRRTVRWESPGVQRRWGSRLPKKRRRHLFEGRGTPHRLDPRLRFWDDDPLRHGLRVDPDLVTVSSWADAMYLSQRFPEVPLIMYFGPPVMLVVAEDVVLGYKAIVARHWEHIRALTRKAVLWIERLCGSTVEPLFPRKLHH